MNNKSNILRKMTMKINRIKRYGGIALEESEIISCQSFYNMDRMCAMRFLDNVICDLTNMRNEFEENNQIVFYSNNYIQLFRKIGLIVKENTVTYDLAHVAYLDEGA